MPYDVPYVLVEKTTVYLTQEMKKRLRATARRRGVPEAELIREGLKVVLAPKPRYPLFASGDPLTAEQIDEILAEGMGMDSLPPEMRKRYEQMPRTGARSAGR